MNTEHLKYLLTIAECQSINRAANRLHLQHQYLSKVVANLESTLGFKIFERDYKGIRVTATGKWALEKARAITALVEELEAGMQIAEKKFYPQFHDEVKLYAAMSDQMTLILEGLTAFRNYFPNVSVNVIEKHLHLIPKEVANDAATIAFYNRIIGWPEKEITLPPELCWISLMEAPLVVLANKNNPLAAKYRSMSISTLMKQELVIYGSDENGGSFLGDFLGEKAAGNIKYTVSNYEIFCTLLPQNPYFSIAPSSKARSGEFLEIPLKENLKVQKGLLFHKDAAAAFVTKNLLNIYLEQFHQSLLE